MQSILIHNPQAGEGAFSAEDLTCLLRQAGYEVRYQSTRDPDFPSAFDEAPADLIVAAGGDGTVLKVAMELKERDTPVAILPAGTANNLATALGLSARRTLDMIANGCGERRKLDLWAACGPWGRWTVLEGCGVGAVAQAAADMPSDAPDDPDEKLGLARKLVREALARLPPVDVRATLDGEVLEGRMLLFDALSVGLVGPRLVLHRNADPGDGLLDVVFAMPEDREALLAWLERGASDEVAPKLQHRRGRELTLSWRDAPVRVGDEIWPCEVRTGEWQEMTLRPLGQAVNVLVPASDAHRRSA